MQNINHGSSYGSRKFSYASVVTSSQSDGERKFGDSASTSSGSTLNLDKTSYTSSVASDNFPCSRNQISYKTVSLKNPPKNIVITENFLIEQKAAKKKLKEIIIQNEREQHSLELDVILSGFSLKPDARVIVDKLFKFFHIPKTAEEFSQTLVIRTDIRDFYHVIITFHDKSTKLLLLENYSILRSPLRQTQLTNLNSSEGNPSITCKHRLSKFNQKVKRHLEDLKARSFVSEYNFNGSVFQFKPNPQATPKLVTDMEVLQPFIDAMIIEKKKFLLEWLSLNG